MAGQHRKTVGANLVDHIAIGGDAVGADNNPTHIVTGQYCCRGAIGVQGDRNAVPRKLPGRQPAALKPGPGFIGIDFFQQFFSFSRRTTPRAVP